MHIFYTPDIKGKIYEFSEAEAKHCNRVLRLLVGDSVNLIDGVGGFYTAIIVEASAKKCIVEITDIKQNFGSRDYKLHIAIAPTKSIDRFEWFLEKATEIGIDEISPICCERSERKMLKIDRAEKVIIAAAKQSIKAYLPKINEITSFSDFIKQEFDGQKFIAHCESLEKVALQKAILAKNNVMILIGPEGDFSVKEIELARSMGFIDISLGNSRLRTETAAVHACSTVLLANEKD